MEDQAVDLAIAQVNPINQPQKKLTPALIHISTRKQEEPIIHSMCIIDL